MTSTRKREARARTAILASATLLLSLALTAVTPAPPAAACGSEISVIAVCPPTGGEPPVPPGPNRPNRPNRGGGGGGGGNGDGPSYCTDTQTTVNQTICESWWPWSKTKYYWFPNRAPGQLVAIGASITTGMVANYPSECDAWAADGGDDRKGGKKYLGVKTFQSGIQELGNNARIVLSRQDVATYTCIARPSFTLDPRDCASTTRATLTGPTRNPDVVSKTSYFGPALSQFAKSGYKNLSLCDKAFQQAFPAMVKDMGQYLLTGTGLQVTCTVRHFTSKNARTGKIPPDEIVEPCQNERLIATSSQAVKWQLWCGGWDLGWNNKHSFTIDECKTNGRWKCENADKAPTFNGVLLPAAGLGVLDDGKKRPATWVVPTPTGTPKDALTNVGSKEISLDLGKGSTPYRGTVDVNGERQPFMVSPKLNSVLTGWANNTWNIGFQAPSLSGTEKMWVATPTWSFVADLKVTTYQLVTVDWRTGKATPSKPVVTSVKAPGTCVGKPLNLAVHRARNTR